MSDQLFQLHAEMDRYLCDDKSDGTDICDGCDKKIEITRDIYFFHDGGFDNDGTYNCYECACARFNQSN